MGPKKEKNKPKNNGRQCLSLNPIKLKSKHFVPRIKKIINPNKPMESLIKDLNPLFLRMVRILQNILPWSSGNLAIGSDAMGKQEVNKYVLMGSNGTLE